MHDLVGRTLGHYRILSEISGLLPHGRIDEGRHMIGLDPTQFLGHWAVGVACTESGAPDEGVAAPFFDPVRGDPRYRALLRRMNLAE